MVAADGFEGTFQGLNFAAQGIDFSGEVAVALTVCVLVAGGGLAVLVRTGLRGAVGLRALRISGKGIE